MFAVLLINFNQPLAILAQPWTLCWKPRETKAPQITDGTAYGERERTQLGVIKPNIWEKSTLWHIRNTRTPATTTTPASLDSSTNLKHGGTGIPRRCQPRVAPSAGEGWGPPPQRGRAGVCGRGRGVRPAGRLDRGGVLRIAAVEPRGAVRADAVPPGPRVRGQLRHLAAGCAGGGRGRAAWKCGWWVGSSPTSIAGDRASH